MKKLEKFLPITNLIALVLTIAVNYLSNAGFINGVTMKVISDRYDNYFTPAGYAFSIWGLIYLGLSAFVCYVIFNRKQPQLTALIGKVGYWFLLSCLANSFWVIAWLNDCLGLSVFIMLVLLFSLVKIIIRTRMELDAHPLKQYLLVYWPFAIYAGWISVALVANVSAYLSKINWDGWGMSDTFWAIAMIGVAGLVNIMMIVTRNLREFAVVGIWALIAISVSNHGQAGREAVVYACYVVSFIVLAFIIGNGMRNRSRSIGSM